MAGVRTRNYTVGDANRTLPYVSAIVADIRERYAAIQTLSRRHNDLPKTDKDERAGLKQRIQTEAQAIHDCMVELETINVELKDYEHGLVDFPAELDGRKILLCWQYGEAEIAFWHETADGFPGRQPVPAKEPDWPAVPV